MVAALVAAWLFLSAAACAQREQDFYDFKAVNIRGKLVSLEKYRGSVSVHPPGLGATPAGPDGGPRGPGPCWVWLRGGSCRPAILPCLPAPTRAFSGGRAAPLDPAPGLSCDYVARFWCAAKPETLAAGADFPPDDFGQRVRTSARGWTPRAQLLSGTGGKSKPSILRPLSFPSPVSASGRGGVADTESSENIVEMNVQCSGSARGPYTDHPLGRTLRSREGRYFIQGHTESTEPEEPPTHGRLL